MAEGKVNSLELWNRQMSGSRKTAEKAMDGFSCFKMLLKNRNQKDGGNPEAKESGKDTEAAAADLAASMMAAGIPEIHNPDDMARAAGQMLQGVLADEAGTEAIQAVVPEDGGKVQAMNPFQSLEQFRYQKLNTEGMPPVIQEAGLMEEGAVQEKAGMPESVDPGILKQDKAFAAKMEDQLLKRMPAEVPDKTEEEPVLAVPSGKQEEKRILPEEDEKRQEKNLEIFQEKSREPGRQLHIHSEKEEPAYITVSADNPEELEARLSEQILKQIHAGKGDLDVQLEPHNLGKIRIKISYGDNQVSVSVLCTESKTLKLLSQSAGDLGSIVESRLERPIQVLVDKQEPDYLNNQQEQGNKQEQRRQHQGSRQDENHEDFIQKLRLGIFETDNTDDRNINNR